MYAAMISDIRRTFGCLWHPRTATTRIDGAVAIVAVVTISRAVLCGGQKLSALSYQPSANVNTRGRGRNYIRVIRGKKTAVRLRYATL